MAGLPPRPVRPVLKWPGGFQIVDGNFTVDGIQWNPGTTLRLLFHPEDHLSCEMDLAATRAKAASLLADKPFLSAQLRFYGIAFRPSMSALDLKLLLKTAVENRLCDATPYSVIDIGPRMQREYKDLLSEWEKKTAEWDALNDSKAAFSECETPVQRANFDPQLFVDYYFLTDGLPDESKTPEPLVMHGCTKLYRVTEQVDRVPGLALRVGGTGPPQIVCIGWGAVAVSAMADKIGKDWDAEQLAKATAAMEERGRYTDKLWSERSVKYTRGRKRRLNVQRCVGSYVLTSYDIEPSESGYGPLTLDIRKWKGDTFIAAFDFGMVNGTMFLSRASENLGAIQHSEERGAQPFGQDETFWEDTLPHGKYKRAKFDRQEEEYLLRFIMRTYEPEYGLWTAFPSFGEITYMDEDCLSFHAIAFSMPGGTTNSPMFMGYKVSDVPRQEPRRWDIYKENEDLGYVMLDAL